MTPITSPVPIQRVPATYWKEIRGVCLDIDDTLSTQGKLTAEAFQALWDLKNAGFWVVPITGRPSGWCDHIARFWPVDAVVGENGAFAFMMVNGKRERFTTPGAAADPKPALENLRQAVLKKYPFAEVASDQAYREYDLAIDICEDVPNWKPADVEGLLKLCSDLGAHAKLSSIHVNAWFGDYDKRRGFENWVAQVTSRGLAPQNLPLPKPGEWIFAGDSPNDEPMFAAFKHSVGVANLAKYLDRLKTPPSYLASKESGAGFVEMARLLIASR